ncbi:DUF3179 domain-containing protein [Maribacter halichondriae]|uniref:DUF3179 domain-containing protein n=1 Tax=Maribacter halichondriae TaxID=2980554 RepID=UPI002358DA79|nr:DUF3179 domain-containing protein [Maribacter sp. Hal144]
MNKILLLTSCLMLFSCSTSSTQETTQTPDEVEIENTSQEWSIPISEVLDGGPGRDGIPALENPPFLAAENVYPILFDEDLVLGYKNGNDTRAYPHIILDWHEIINDNIGDVSLAITYCPLTGTGIGWNRVIDGNETTFGVSGLLYQTNLVPFDRATKSNWSQILNESVNGSLSGEKADLIQLVETDWATWRAMFPTTKVVSLETDFDRTYGVYPYSSYKTNNDFFLFPTPKDNRLPLKERVHAIIDNDKAKAYRFSNFDDNNVFKDTFNGKDYLIVGNSKVIVSFKLDTTQNTSNFEFIYNGSGEAFVQDDNGNQWNIFGELVVGSGNALKASSSFMGYWFSIPAFYETEVYGE